MKSKLFTAALAALMLSSCTPKENGYFDNLPQEANPIEIGAFLWTSRIFTRTFSSRQKCAMSQDYPPVKHRNLRICSESAAIWMRSPVGAA